MSTLHDFDLERELSLMSTAQREEFILSLSPTEQRRLLVDKTPWLRPSQRLADLVEAAQHDTILVTAGRGFGKTLAGGIGGVHEIAMRRPHLAGGRGTGKRPGEGCEIGIAGRTHRDVIETMLRGPSGLLTCVPPEEAPTLNLQHGTLLWPNGARARLMSGDTPESFRGPNFGLLWADELAHWIRAQASWDMAQMALRHGPRPVAIVTTTPIGSPLILSIAYDLDDAGMPKIDDAGDRIVKRGTLIVTGDTRDNSANLARSYLAKIERDFGGTRLGEQELRGAILIGSPGAVWSIGQIKRCSITDVPAKARKVIAVDPAAKSAEGSDESGVVLAAEFNGSCWILGDFSGRHTPAELRSIVQRLAYDHRCEVVVEDNQGGDYLREVLGSGSTIKIRPVSAVKGKRERWTSAALAYDQGKVWHAAESRSLVAVEHQMTSADPDDKQAKRDRADALAWAVLDLLGVDQGAARMARVTAGSFRSMIRGIR